MSGARPQADQAGRATRGTAKASPPSGDHPSREGFTYAQYRETIDDFVAVTKEFAELAPTAFKTKRRAHRGIWLRAACWTVFVLIAVGAEYVVHGRVANWIGFVAGLWAAAILIYFDPPPTNTTYTWRRDSDGNGEADETENTGSARKGDSAGSKSIAQ